MDYVLCFDPTSSNFYTYQIDSKLIQLEQDCPQELLNRAIKESLKIQEIIKIANGDYDLNSKEADFYRKMYLPPYLIKKSHFPIPTYLVESNLSAAYMNISNI